MINSYNINKTIKIFLESNSNITIAMLLDNNRPQPKEPYICYKVSSLSKIGDDSSLPPDNTGLSEVKGDREFILRLYYYGDDSLFNLESIISKIELQSNLNLFRDNGFIYVQPVNEISNVPEEFDNRILDRSIVDLQFRTVSVITDNVGLIEDVDISGTLKIDDIVKKTLQITINT